MTEHVPVMLERCLALLAPAVSDPGAVVVDATLGLGGHSAGAAGPAPRRSGWSASTATPRRSRARRATPGALGRPHDPRARGLRRAARRARPARPRARPGRAVRPRASPRCSSTRPIAASPTPTTRRSTCGWTATAASPPPRCSTPTRPTTWPGCCAEYGEERFAAPDRRSGRRARAGREPFTSTRGWSTCVRDAIPAATRRTGGNPAKRTFQALRIEVNGELAALSARSRRRSRRSPSAAGSW